MAKLIIVYTVTDDCTYSNDVIVPLEYASAEAFLIDFDNWAKGCLLKVAGTSDYPQGKFTVGNHEFEIENFRYLLWKTLGDRSKDRKWEISLPDIYTLEEWFQQNKAT
jgi:hypothetical protein